MSSIVTPDEASRAVTSSPGSCRAKPSTSNPHATFDTVAGANAVTASIAALILTATTLNAELAATLSFLCVLCGLCVDRRGSAVIALANRRDQVLTERAVEIVRRVEAPVAPRGGVVHRRAERLGLQPDVRFRPRVP